MTDIVERLRVGFRGQGLARAIRRKEDEPCPGEPYMSMDDAMPLLNEAADEIEHLRDKINNHAFKLADKLRAEIERLREALEKTRAAIIQSAADTLWVGDIETAVDCIDAALNGDTK